MKYVCDKVGNRRGCLKQCPHGSPHELIEIDNNHCDKQDYCAGWGPDYIYKQILVQCKPIKSDEN